MFAGRLDPRELTLPQRASLLVFRGMRGDFRDWGVIKVWACGIAGQLAAEAKAEETASRPRRCRARGLSVLAQKRPARVRPVAARGQERFSRC